MILYYRDSGGGVRVRGGHAFGGARGLFKQLVGGVEGILWGGIRFILLEGRNHGNKGIEGRMNLGLVSKR